MAKFGAPLVARSSAAGQLGAVFFLAFGLFVACGNDIPEVPGGGDAGGSGRAGSSSGKAGNGGEGAEAGEEQVAGAAGSGEAGMVEPGGPSGSGGTNSSGGTSGKGGSVGVSGAGGKGGSGGSGPVCGNNVLDAGEACDDGNTKFGDSCSPTCTNVCETCEKDVCGAAEDFFGCDYLGDATATAGPGAGTKKSILCQSLVACYKRTECATDPDSFVKKCYCGTANPTDCALPGKPDGACREEMAAAGETRERDLLVSRALKPQYALGLASDHVLRCTKGLCAAECVLGKPQTDCQKCSGAFGFESMAACYVNPTGDPELSAELCSAAVECAHRTGCALNDIASCYGVVTGAVLSVPGPCATEFSAASKGLTPPQIAAVIQGPFLTSPLAAAWTELKQELYACKETCFPTTSGGASGGGAGGTSGAGGGVTGGTGG